MSSLSHSTLTCGVGGAKEVRIHGTPAHTRHDEGARTVVVELPKRQQRPFKVSKLIAAILPVLEIWNIDSPYIVLEDFASDL